MTTIESKAGEFHRAVTEFRRRLIVETLAAHQGNRTKTAKALGLQRTYLFALIREYGIGRAA